MTRFEKLKEIIDCLQQVTMEHIEKHCKECKDIHACSCIAEATFSLKGDFES